MGGMTKMLISLGIFLLLLPLARAGDRPDGVQSEQKELLPGDVTLETLRYKGKVPKGAALVIENPYGDVHARFGGYERELEIVASVQRLGRRVDLRVMEEEGELVARVMESAEKRSKRAELGRADRADLAVFVPKGVPVRIETRKGAIDCKKLESDATLESATGNIKVVAGKGRLVAKSERGKIVATFDPGEFEGTSILQSRQGDVLVYVAETADMQVELKTAGEIATDYSLDLVYRRDEAPPKVAHAEIGKPKRLLVVESDVGKVALYRIVKILNKGNSARKH